MNKTKRAVLDSIKQVYKLEDYTDANGAFHSADRKAKKIYNNTIKGIPKKHVAAMLRKGGFHGGE